MVALHLNWGTNTNYNKLLKNIMKEWGF
jgi:phage anti-repressor protein